MPPEKCSTSNLIAFAIPLAALCDDLQGGGVEMGDRGGSIQDATQVSLTGESECPHIRYGCRRSRGRTLAHASGPSQ